MAHEVETMMSGRGEKPWHFGETGRTGQTTVVDHAPKAAEALKLAKLDWRVDLEPTYRRDKKGEYQLIEGRKAVVRSKDGAVLGSVGSAYVPLQNVEAFEFLDNLLDEGLEYDTAGSLRGGQTVFMTAKLPREVLIGGEDAHELYIFVSNDHRGLHAVRVAVTPIRIVCQNTMNLALRNCKRTWSAPHLSTLKGRMADAREALELTWRYCDAFEAEAERLLGEKLSQSAFDDFVDKLLDTPQIGPRAAIAAQTGITALYEGSTTCAPFRGTAWGALNAVGEYYDWAREPETDESRLIGSIEGIAVKMRDRALALLS